MLSPSARTHLLYVGLALLVAGVLVPLLIPGVSLWWGVGAVAVGSHVGLLLVAGGAALRWISRRFGTDAGVAAALPVPDTDSNHGTT